MARKGYRKTRKPAGDPGDPQGMAVLLAHHLDGCVFTTTPTLLSSNGSTI